METQDFTGLRSFLTDNLEFARLGVSIPPRLPKYGWTEVGAEEEPLISMKPAIVTVEAPPAIQYAIGDPVVTTTASDVAGLFDTASGTIQVKRTNRGRVVFQTIDPLKRKIEFTEILE